MAQRRLVVLFLTLLTIFYGNVQAEAAPNLPFRRQAQQVDYNVVGRQPPNLVLPPEGSGVADQWRTAFRDSVRGTEATSIWDGLKSGMGTKINLQPVKIAKFAGRQIGYGILQGVGIQLAFSAIDGFGKWLFNQSADAFGNDLRNCINVGKSEGMSFGAGMTCSFIPTVANAPHGPWPTPAWAKEIYWIKNAGARSLSVIAQGVNDEYSASKPVTHVEVRWFCPSYMGSQRIPLSDVDAFMNQVIEYCYEAPGPVPTPIPLQTWVDGGKVNNVEVPPHPEIKQDIKNALDLYIKTSPVDLSGQKPMIPEISLDRYPTENETYGVATNIYEDLDGDGWADAEEIARGSDPGDAQSVPDPLRDTDGDGVSDMLEDELGTNPYDPASKPDPVAGDEVVSVKTTTTKNPDGSTTRRTVTTYADGTTKTVAVTTKTTKTTNPDGSVTTTTTTTTETTNRDGTKTTKTSTKEETTPAPEPTPEPPKEEGPCLAMGGTWDGSACTLPPKESAPGAQPEFSQPDAFKKPDWSGLKNNYDQKLKTFTDLAKTKPPFGIAEKWFPKAGTVGADCPSISMDVNEYIKGRMTPCDTQIARDAHGIVRPVLVFVLALMFGMWGMRTVMT